MTAVQVAMAVLAVLAVWLLVALSVCVPLGRWLRRIRRSTTTPALQVTDRGKWTALLALSFLLSIGLAFATRGQFLTWDGFQPIATEISR